MKRHLLYGFVFAALSLPLPLTRLRPSGHLTVSVRETGISWPKSAAATSAQAW